MSLNAFGRKLAVVTAIGQTHYSTVARQLNFQANRFDALILGVDKDYPSQQQLRGALRHPHIEWLEVEPGASHEILALAGSHFKKEFDYLVWIEPEWGMVQLGLVDRSALKADAYYLRCTYQDGFERWNPILLSTRLNWQYDIATQRPVTNSPLDQTGHIDALLVISSRSAEMEKLSCARSINALLDNHETDPLNSIHCFYLGHYFLRMGDPGNARQWFEVCLGLEPENPVEKSLAAFHIIEFDKQNEAVSVARYYEIFELAPERAEALYSLVTHFQHTGPKEKAFELAKIAFNISRPRDEYPIDSRIYNYKIAHTTADLAALESDHQTVINTTSWLLEKNILPEEADTEIREMRSRSLNRYYPVYPVNSGLKNQISVIVCFRNAGHYLRRCVESIRQQDYEKFRVFLVDDYSDDGCTDNLGLDSRFKLIHRTKRREALSNQHDILMNHCEEQDIALFLDGDDWLLGTEVFSYINRVFNQSSCWVSYGQCIKNESQYKLCTPLKPSASDDHCSLGSGLKFPIHPRCHRAGLYHRIADQDPEFLCLKDNDGSFYKPGSDFAHMRAMFQLAGPEKIRFIDKPLYVYNFRNPDSTHHTRQRDMLEACLRISNGPCLETIDNYTTAKLSAAGNEKKTQLLVVSLEGFDTQLARTWMDQGLLPALSKLEQEGSLIPLDIEPGFFSTDAFLTSSVTGKKPQNHQNLWSEVLKTGSYDLIPGDEPGLIEGKAYWDVLSKHDLKVCTLNYYAQPLSQEPNVTQFQNWGVHVSWGALRSHPKLLAEDLIDRFGDKHLNVSSERTSELSVDEYLDLRKKMLQRLDSKLSAYTHYLGHGDWDVYHVSFDEAHDIGHQLWHAHDPQHPDHPCEWLAKHGDPLLEIYQALDASISVLSDTAGTAELLIIAGPGMESSSSCSYQLNDMLQRIHSKETGESQKQLEADWTRQCAFTLQSNNQLGAIRLNVSGREPSGWVQPGEDFEQWCQRIEIGLNSFHDPDSGLPVVDHIVRTRTAAHASSLSALSDSLPDLIVVWARNYPPGIARSASLGDIKIEMPPDNPLSYRSGDHNSNAALFSSSPLHFSEKRMPLESVAATICRYFNVDMPHSDAKAAVFLDSVDVC